MRKFFKILFVLGLGFIGLLVVLAIAVRIFFPPEKVKKWIDQQIRTQLHREAKLENAHLGLRGITLTGFKLSEVPSFSAGTFLSVDTLDVRWSLAPLLARHLAIQRIVLQKPMITLIKMADGITTNISDLSQGSAAPATQPAEKKAAAPSSFTWHVNEIRLQDGLVRYEDRSPTQLNTTLSSINLRVHDFAADRMQGSLGIGSIDNVIYKGKEFTADWALKHIDPSLAHVTGFLKLKQGPGLIHNLTALSNVSPGARVALTPLLMLQNLSKNGLVDLGLPDLSKLTVNSIQGDYALNDGTMKINQLNLDGPEVSIAAPGTINLANGALSMDVALHTPKPTMLGAMDLKMHVGGTISHPKADIASLKKKAFKAGVTKVLSSPDAQKKINDAFKSIFH